MMDPINFLRWVGDKHPFIQIIKILYYKNDCLKITLWTNELIRCVLADYLEIAFLTNKTPDVELNCKFKWATNFFSDYVSKGWDANILKLYFGLGGL